MDTKETTNTEDVLEQDNTDQSDVDTSETTEQGTEEIELPEEDQDWTEEQQKQYIAQMLKGGKTSDTTSDDVDTDEETSDSDEDESNEAVSLEIEVEGEKEVFDLNDEEQRKKLIQYAGKGRYLEKERQKDKEAKQEFEKEKQLLTQQANSVAFQMMYLASQGKLNAEEFQEKPYEDFIGEGEDEDEDRKLWKEHNDKVKTNLKNLEEYSKRYKQTHDSFKKVVNSFSEKHPDIKDTAKWIEENMTPYHLPIATYGAVEYPEDTLEMIYFWRNKDKIIKEEVSKALKDYVKKPLIKKQTSGGTPNNLPQNSNDAVSNMVKNIFNPLNKKLVR